MADDDDDDDDGAKEKIKTKINPEVIIENGIYWT